MRDVDTSDLFDQLTDLTNSQLSNANFTNKLYSKDGLISSNRIRIPNKGVQTALSTTQYAYITITNNNL